MLRLRAGICEDPQRHLQKCVRQAEDGGWRTRNPTQMTPAQCRAARALVDVSEAKLAHVAVVPITAVRDFELTGKARPPDIEAIRAELERAGVEFLNDVGVKLRKSGK